MNKSYKLVWSFSRNAWIVAHESSRGRGKSGGRIKTACGAVAAALLTLACAPAFATADSCSASGSNTIDASVTAPCLLTTSDSVEIVNDGTLLGGISFSQSIDNVSGNLITHAIYVTGATGGVTNSGTIAGTSTGANADVNNFVGAGIHLERQSTDAGITNSAGGLITGTSSGTGSGDYRCYYDFVGNFFGAGIYLEGGGTNGITNAGTISGLSTQTGYRSSDSDCDDDDSRNGNYFGVGVALSSAESGGSLVSTVSGGLTNDGLIKGAGASGTGVSVAFVSRVSTISDTGAGRILNGVSNSGTIQGVGTTRSGGGIYVNQGSITGGIANSGLIEGSGPRYGTGIFHHAGLISGGITNSVSGTIRGEGTDQRGAGIFIYGSVTGGIANHGLIEGANNYSSGYGIFLSSGEITGGITNSGIIQGNYGIYSYGTISGGITTSADNSALTNIYNGGTIQGDVFAITDTDGTTSGTIGGGIYLFNGGQVIGDVKAITDVYVGMAGQSYDYVLPAAVTGGSGSFASARRTPHNRAADKNDAKKSAKKARGGTFASQSTTFANTNAFDVRTFTVMDGETFEMSAGGSVSGGLATRGVKVSDGFTNAGTVFVDVDAAPTITGDYSQSSGSVSGTFSTSGTVVGNFGKLAVTGTVTLPAGAKFQVVTNTGGSCSDLTAGQTISGVISSSGVLTATTFAAVDDDCDNLDFTAHKNGNAVDLWVIAAGGGSVSGSCGSAANSPVSSAPSTNLCSEDATASGMSGSGPWTWNCGEATCTAPLYTPVVYYPPPPPATNVDLPTGGGTAKPVEGQSVTVTDNGKEGSSIDLPPPLTTPPAGASGTPGSGGINVILPGTGTISVSSNAEGTKLGVQSVTLPGANKDVSTVMVTQGSASFTATQPGQPVASLKNGIFVVSGTTNSQVTVDATGADAKIGITSSDTIVVPTGSANVSGTSVDLPPPGAGGGAAGAVNVKIGDQNLTIQANQPDTTMTFKVVDIGGVQTPVLAVTGSAQVSGSGDNQPIVSVAGNVIRTGKSSGGGQVCNTIVQASSDTSSDVVHVVTCYIVLEPGTFSAMNGGKGNGFATIKDGIVWAGETAEFDKNGMVTSAYLGTRPGDTDAVGDDMVPGGNKFAAAGYTVGAFIPRLAGTPLRLNGAKLDERIFSVINKSLGVTVQPALPLQSDQGVLNFTFAGNLNGQGVQNPQVNYTVNTDTASLMPSRRIRVDTGRADGVSISAEGDVSVATGGLITTFAPSVADPKAFAEKVGQALPGANSTLRWNGTWHVTAGGGATYVGRPQWSYWAAEPGAATFATQPDGSVLFSDKGRAQPLFPDFYDYDTLQATFRSELKDPSLTVLPRMDGTATATVNGLTYTLAPQWNLIKPAAGKPAWWMENGVVYIKNADGSAQGFTVK